MSEISELLKQYGIDPEKHYPGSLCKRSHDWQGTGMSLRRKKDGKCPKCCSIARQGKKRNLLGSNQDERILLEHAFDPSMFYLGSLCPWNHAFYKTGMSLRYKRNGCCRECNRNRKKLGRMGSIKISQEQKALLTNYRVDPSKFYLGSLCVQSHKFANTGMSLRWHNGNCVECAKVSRDVLARSGYYKRYYEKNKEAAFLRSSRRRALKSGNHHIEITPDQKAQRIAEFDGKCAYCGQRDFVDMDHFIPLSYGGPDTLNNLIPSCDRCNSSKWNIDPWEWYQWSPFFSKKRWSKILRILGRTHATYNQLPLL